MSVNLVILVGNLTRDAEVRTVGQQQVAKFGLATSERFRKQDGTQGESTEFHNIELWGNTGVYPYLVKGQSLYVQGSIKTDRFTGQDGQERTAVKIKAFSVQLLGPKPQQAAPAAPQYPGYAPQYAQPQAPAYPPQYRTVPPAPPVPPVPPAPPAPAPAPQQSTLPLYAQQAGHEYAQDAAPAGGDYDDLPAGF